MADILRKGRIFLLKGRPIKEKRIWREIIATDIPV
jgi:hypothetical protein